MSRQSLPHNNSGQEPDYERLYLDLREWLMGLVGVASTINGAKRAVERCVEDAVKRNREAMRDGSR